MDIFKIINDSSLPEEDKNTWKMVLEKADSDTKDMFHKMFESDTSDLETVTDMLKKKIAVKEGKMSGKDVIEEERQQINSLLGDI